MATTSMSLGKHWEDYLAAKVASGEFKTKAEVMRDALRRQEAREKNLETLRAYIKEGEDSGFVEWDPDAFKQRIDRKYKNVAESGQADFTHED